MTGEQPKDLLQKIKHIIEFVFNCKHTLIREANTYAGETGSTFEFIDNLTGKPVPYTKLEPLLHYRCDNPGFQSTAVPELLTAFKEKTGVDFPVYLTEPDVYEQVILKMYEWIIEQDSREEDLLKEWELFNDDGNWQDFEKTIFHVPDEKVTSVDARLSLCKEEQKAYLLFTTNDNYACNPTVILELDITAEQAEEMLYGKPKET